MNLVKKLALTLAATATVVSAATLATGCFFSDEHKLSLTSTLATDISMPINQIIYVMPEFSNNNSEHYVSFIAHYGAGKFGYDNHKDVRVTYKISAEEYKEVNNCCSICAYEWLHNIDDSSFELLKNIIENYDPVEIKDIQLNSDHDFKEEYRFQAEPVEK